MCLIIDQPRGVILTDKHVADVYRRNPDGFGVMRYDEHVQRVRTLRALPRDEQEALDLYREHGAGRACVLHWRYATHGAVNLAMAHPFRVSDTLHVVHNGIIRGYGSHDESDTAEFVRRVLAPTFPAPGDVALLASERVREQMRTMARGGCLVFSGTERDGSHRVVRVGYRGIHVRAHDGETSPTLWYSNAYAWSAPTRVRNGWASDTGDAVDAGHVSGVAEEPLTRAHVNGDAFPQPVPMLRPFPHFARHNRAQRAAE